MVMTYLAGWMLSGSRYTATLMPAYILAARIKNPKLKAVILAVCGMGTVLITTLYLRKYSIM